MMEESTVTLVSSDSESFVVKRSVAEKFKVLGPMLEDNAETVPLPQVHSKQLSEILEFANKDPPVEISDFVELTTDQDLMALIGAVNYLNYPVLLEGCLKEVVSRVRSMTTKELRTYLGVVNDFTPQEETELALENEWDFE